MDRSDAARLLGVTEDASEREIRRAFRERVRALHPDTSDVEDADIDLLTDARDRLLAPAPKPFESPFPARTQSATPAAPATPAARATTGPTAPNESPAPKIRYANDPTLADLAPGCLPIFLVTMAILLFGFFALVFVLLGSPETEPPLSPELVEAECVRVDGPQLDVVDCGVAGAQRIVARSEAAITCPSGQNSLLVGSTTWCLEPAAP